MSIHDSRFRLRPLPLVGLLALAFPLLGAKGGGCSAEVQPGDGRSAEWRDPGDGGDGEGGLAEVVPTPNGPDQPMTCAWLESDNCWKQASAAARACAPSSEGRFDAERANCAFPDGARLELAGPISTPADGSNSIVFVDHRVLDSAGSTCFGVRALGIGKGAVATRRGTAVIEWKSLSSYRIVCPNGDAYATDVAGACENAGSRWLAKQAPNYSFECDGSRGSCTAVFWGSTPSGPQTTATCR